MTPRPWSALVRKEFREALRSRWLFAFTAVFILLALGLSFIGDKAASLGGGGFGRTTAALLNLVLLIVPLMSLLLGALSVAGERERGTLETLLALPLKPSQVFWSKAAGLGLALAASLAAAFGAAGMVLAGRGGLHDGGLLLRGFAATLLLAAAGLSIGLALSVLSRRVAQATGAAMLVWLGLVFAGDLGLLGTSVVLGVRPGALLAASWANPLSLFRLLCVAALDADLEVLGPAGQCAFDILGGWLAPAALAGLAVWVAAPLGLAARRFVGRPLP